MRLQLGNDALKCSSWSGPGRDGVYGISGELSHGMLPRSCTLHSAQPRPDRRIRQQQQLATCRRSDVLGRAGRLYSCPDTSG